MAAPIRRRRTQREIADDLARRAREAAAKARHIERETKRKARAKVEAAIGRVIVRHIHRDDVDAVLTTAFAGLLWDVITQSATDSEQALLARFEPPPATDQDVDLTEIALRERGTL